MILLENSETFENKKIPRIKTRPNNKIGRDYKGMVRNGYASSAKEQEYSQKNIKAENVFSTQYKFSTLLSAFRFFKGNIFFWLTKSKFNCKIKSNTLETVFDCTKPFKRV
jgi:hypothetical protein